MIKNRNSAEELKELEKNLKSLWAEMIELFKIPEIVEKVYQLLESVKKWRVSTVKKLIDKVLEVLDSKYAENFAVAIMFISQLIIAAFCVKFVFLVFKALEKYIGI